MNCKSIAVFLLSALIFLTSAANTLAQQAAPVQCGSIIESELINDGANPQDYTIQLAPGDTLDIRLEPVGGTLDLEFFVLSPVGENIELSSLDGKYSNPSNYGNRPFDYAHDGQVEEGSTPILSARGSYTIRVRGYVSQDIGLYTLYVGCTLRDGTIILPGDVAPTALLSGENSSSPSATLAFSGTGFPGLAPVDFSSVAKIPLPAGIAMSGGITPTGGEILGYTLDGNAGDTLDLTFTRLSGNLNLGLVVLSADNKVVFQASLVSSTTLNSRFTLPSAGTYTIGVFRIDLIPPAAPEATAFQVQGTLNP
ncbi:MAG: PPC domain-containing protein [Chloroflexota bacterium]